MPSRPRSPPNPADKPAARERKGSRSTNRVGPHTTRTLAMMLAPHSWKSCSYDEPTLRLWLLDGDEDVFAIDRYGVDGHPLGGRRPERLAGTEVKARTVQPALDRAVLDFALGQRHRG